MMTMPYVVDGDIEDLTATLKLIASMGLENVIQGHGDIILRGEIPGMIEDDRAYLNAIRKAVKKASRRKYPQDLLYEIDVESCGKDRVLLGGLAETLHQRNLRALYTQIYGEPPAESEDMWDDE
jgi:hypothetical protein